MGERVIPDVIVSTLKMAAETGHYSGLVTSAQDRAYMRRCSARYRPCGITLIYTRDIGHHSSGWFKNPDYERCYHLSLSFFDPESLMPRTFNRRAGHELSRLFFGDDTRLLWIEPPYSAEGKLRGVHHYRLFCDPGWQPIKPRGEVYNTEFTEKGWKSFSELHAAEADPLHGVQHSMGEPG